MLKLLLIILLNISVFAGSYEDFKNNGKKKSFSEIKQSYIDKLNFKIKHYTGDSKWQKARLKSVKSCVKNTNNIQEINTCIPLYLREK